ncbi:MAG TPA: signal peptidase II [Gemmatimonadota bacterium]|nr:signal peptidase II [Gemmatimonadota bacterium]
MTGAAGETSVSSAVASAVSEEPGVHKGALLLAVAGITLVLDVLTKQWIVATLVMYEVRPVFGEFFRLTYTHNPGAAFGINIGEHSRLFFLALSLVALVVLGWMYRVTPRRDVLRLTALALVCGGAVGNIFDRLRYEAGVVDFIDIGYGGYRFWIFNIADSAVSVGAVLLLISFYLEERREARAVEASRPPD